MPDEYPLRAPDEVPKGFLPDASNEMAWTCLKRVREHKDDKGVLLTGDLERVKMYWSYKRRFTEHEGAVIFTIASRIKTKVKEKEE